jgi:hypothetical protein
MARTAIWIIAFSPIIAMFVIGSGNGEQSAGLSTALAIAQGPLFLFAAILEYWFLKRRGVSATKGSTVGNRIAQILGLIFVALLIWGVFKIVINNH